MIKNVHLPPHKSTSYSCQMTERYDADECHFLQFYERA